MLEFLAQLRKVWPFAAAVHLLYSLPDSALLSPPALSHRRVSMQKHTVGIVGGSDLSKIKEQLGDDGTPAAPHPCVVGFSQHCMPFRMWSHP